MCNHFNNAMKGKSTKFQERRHMSLYETTCTRESELVVGLSLQQLLPLDFVKSVSSEKHIRVRFVNFHNALMERKSVTKTVRGDVGET